MMLRRLTLNVLMAAMLALTGCEQSNDTAAEPTHRYDASSTGEIRSAVKTVSATNGKIFAGYGAGGNGMTEIDLINDSSTDREDGNDSYVKLLLHADGENNATTDSDYSSSAHTLTFEGDAKISTTQAKFGNSSYYFDGNDYIESDNTSDWDFGSGDFTVDWWEYRPSSGGAAISRDCASSAQAFLFAFNGDLVYMSSPAGAWDIAYQRTIGSSVIGAWSHLAVVRSGNNFYTFRDGVQQDTWSSSLSLRTHASGLCLGRTQNGANNMNGYLDEIRVSKGIARWTSNFTVPSRRYDLPISDIESNFDGTNTNIWMTYGKSDNTGTSAGTVYYTDSGGDGTLDTNYGLTSDTGYWGSKIKYDSTNDDLYVAQTKGDAGTDIWSKIGSPKISADSTIDTADSTDRVTSMEYTYDLTADTDNVYFATSDGVKAVAKSSFSSGVTDTLDAADFSELPSTGNDTYSKLMLHGDGFNGQKFDVDSSGSDHALTFSNGASISTTKSKFGGSSYYFDGTDDYISLSDSDDWSFGNGDFTVDGWIYKESGSIATWPFIASQWTNNNNANSSWYIRINTDDTLRFTSVEGSSANALDTSGAIPSGWVHFAIVRNGNTLRIFLNGTKKAENTSYSLTLNNPAIPLIVGEFDPGGGSDQPFKGYIDEFRISKGIARWTSDFTPPTEPYHMGAMSVDYSSTVGKLLTAFSGLGVISGTDGSSPEYYDNFSETDVDRSNILVSDVLTSATFLSNVIDGYTSFAVGSDLGISLVHTVLTSAGSSIPRPPAIDSTSGFLIF